MEHDPLVEPLRVALNHLYDPNVLRRSPLAQWLGVAGRGDTPSVLRRILTDAIEALRPVADTPGQPHNQRLYDLLLYRYIQQFSQQEVADQLNLSLRHMRREQQAALAALASHLREHVPAASLPPVSDATPPVLAELAWLKDRAPAEATAFLPTLAAATALLRPLSQQYAARLTVDAPADLPPLAANPMAVRQLLLGLLGIAIRQTPGGTVHVAGRRTASAVEVQITCPTARPGATTGDADETLAMAHQLAALCSGTLTLADDAHAFGACLTLPTIEPVTALVIDDNQDTLQLLERYAAGTRFRIIGTSSPMDALALTAQVMPQIIVLDVMMPKVDGWELLGRLRHHPPIRNVPIIVCTILPQEELALSLGASGFLRKPVTPEAFLAALDAQATASR